MVLEGEGGKSRGNQIRGVSKGLIFILEGGYSRGNQIRAVSKGLILILEGEGGIAEETK